MWLPTLRRCVARRQYSCAPPCHRWYVQRRGLPAGCLRGLCVDTHDKRPHRCPSVCAQTSDPAVVRLLTRLAAEAVHVLGLLRPHSLHDAAAAIAAVSVCLPGDEATAHVLLHKVVTSPSVLTMSAGGRPGAQKDATVARTRAAVLPVLVALLGDAGSGTCSALLDACMQCGSRVTAR